MAQVGPRETKLVRAATVDDVPRIARIHIDAWRETYPGILPDAVLDALRYDEREEQWRRSLAEKRSCSFVAEVDGDVVGFVRGGANRDPSYARDYPGELQALYLLKAYQGVGVGRALFENVRFWLTANELSPFLVWVISTNPFRAFYERLGGTWITSQPTEIRGARVSETAYGWR